MKKVSAGKEETAVKEDTFLARTGAVFGIPEELQKEPENETVLYDWTGGVADEDEQYA